MVVTRRRSAEAALAQMERRSPQLGIKVGEMIEPSHPQDYMTDQVSVKTTFERSIATASHQPSAMEQEAPSNAPRHENEAPFGTSRYTRSRLEVSAHVDRVCSLMQHSPVIPSPARGASAANPIELSESPPHRTRHVKRRKTTEPHRFQERHRTLHTYRPPSRIALTAKPVNKTIFTGDQSYDMDMTVHSKVAASTTQTTKKPFQWGHRISIKEQMPLGLQLMAQPQTSLLPPPQLLPTQAFSLYCPLLNNAATQLHSVNEQTLREKVLYMVRHYSRPGPCAELALDDIDDSSSSLFGESSLGQSLPIARPPLVSSQIRSKAATEPNQGQAAASPSPTRQLLRLAEPTSLLNTLLQVYPHSQDQQGLRQDMKVLLSVQNQLFTEWIETEMQIARKGSVAADDDSAICIGGSSGTAQNMQELKGEKDKDDGIRQIFSATAGIWQDGSGRGVVDVYAAAPLSSPARQDDESTRSMEGTL